MAELALIHLSDIHLSSPAASNWWLSHKSKFIDSIARACAGCQQAIIVLSGDLANTGQSNEFDVFIDLLLDIHAALDERCAITDVHVFTVPGNHDCDFGPKNDRAFLLRATDEELSDALINQICSVQDQFFATVAQIEDLDNAPSGMERLHRVRRLSVFGKTIVFNLLNSAWTSTKHEEYGSLRMPAQIRLADDADLVITVIHHPISWLRVDDGQAIREQIIQHSDVVLTGHVHTSKSGVQTYSTGEGYRLFEAGALQERVEGDGSEFRVLRINLDDSQVAVIRYALASGEYIATTDEPAPLINSRTRVQTAFQPTPDFTAWLEDPGAGFRHVKVKTLRLSDFFVMPNLLRSTAGADGKRLIKDAAVLEEITNKRSLILGPENSGKTAFLRSISRELLRSDIVPCVVQAAQLSKSELRNADDLFVRTISAHYGDAAAKLFNAMDMRRRALVLDDLQSAKISAEQLASFLAAAYATFGTIVVTSTSDFALQELVEGGKHAGAVADLEHYQLVEFGYRQRKTLLRRWYSLGLSLSSREAEDEFERTVSVLNDDLTEAIRRGFLPAFPSHLMLILQTTDAKQKLDSSIGAYGQLYQRVIYDQLFAQDPSIDTETKASFLAGVAGEVWRRPSAHVSIKDLQDWYKKYDEKYGIGIPWDRLWKAARATRILRIDGDQISFNYPFTFAYFLALFINQQLPREERAIAIKKLVDHIHLDDSASTIVCLIQQTKDEFIVDVIVERVEQIFLKTVPADLVNDTKFINNWITSLPQRSLPDRIDRSAEEPLGETEDVDEEDAEVPSTAIDPSSDVGQIIVQFSAGYRLVQAIGQILRAFAGAALKAEQKQRLCRACFDVGLRTIGFYLEIVKAEQKDLPDQIAARIRELHPRMKDPEIYAEVSRKVFFLLEQFAISVVRHISRAIGTDRIDTVLRKCIVPTSNSDKIIDLSIRLDHYKEFPMSLVNEMSDGGGSRFAMAIVRDLVWQHLHIVERDRKLRQQVCEMLQIRMVPKLLYNKDIKRLPGRN